MIGATVAAVIVALVALLASPLAAALWVLYAFLYQQAEHYLIQPVVYGRTVRLSPLAVLIAVLIGAEIAGVIGALAAIPVAGTIQVLIVDWLKHRRPRRSPDPTPTTV